MYLRKYQELRWQLMQELGKKPKDMDLDKIRKLENELNKYAETWMEWYH